MNLSVIIPMYNVEEYISHCIDSLLDQHISVNDYEIIIIDDGSTDNSLSIAKEYEATHANITVYHHPNIGLSSTRNKGINLAKGDYIYFIDSDDYIVSNTLKQLVECAVKNQLDVLEFNFIRTASRDYNTSKNENTQGAEIEVLDGYSYMSTRGFFDGVWAHFYKRDFLIQTKIKFIDGRIMEDMLFNAEIISKAQRVAFLPLDVYRYVINPNSVWTTKEPTALRQSIDDFIFMTINYSEVIQDFENKNVNSDILKSKQQNMLYNTVKRILQSDYKFSEINQIFDTLATHHLYPLPYFKGKDTIRKLIVFSFNNKYLFFTVVLFYRVFEFFIHKFVVKRHRAKKEEKIKSDLVILTQED